MLAVSPLENITTPKHDHYGSQAAEASSDGFTTVAPEEFPEFAGHGSLLDTIDFDDLFTGIDCGDVLPDLEIPDLSASSAERAEENNTGGCGDDKFSCTSGREEYEGASRSAAAVNRSKADGEKRKKTSKGSKNKESRGDKNDGKNQGKRKVKVDWTPDLHRRFVQAVEQLGVDKAVPSRILELMGIDYLTRHNVASHLQKYRSHRKHLQAREAEARSWSHKRQVYGTTAVAAVAAAAGSAGKTPWVAPAVGFPPAMHHPPHYQPLHVWGHPTAARTSPIHPWPKQYSPQEPSPPLPPLPHSPAAWGHPPPPPLDPSSYWPQSVQPVAPWLPHQFPASTRFSAAVAVTGIPPAPPRRQGGNGVPAAQSSPPPPPIDLHPSKESIDAAIGDVLAKRWLPLGLKPPRLETVMVELQRQGVSKIPPASSW